MVRKLFLALVLALIVASGVAFKSDVQRYLRMRQM